ncbi:MAG: MEMO1 family protein [Methanobacterium sp.]|uniref:AmmeMemoRadiSam system protein B n=1 Tax=Methanobacterium sp. TaxID=2164 RepID=UPI003D652FD6|nr:MEMO1 family protein [Methanobacterium sp.]
MIRKPAVAGIFYEENHDSLKKQIEWCFEHRLGPGKIPSVGTKREIKGLMVPHAGYIYSGPVAAHSYCKLAEDGFPETFVILSPNHNGLGSAISTMIEGEWETPLGNVEIDTEFARELVEDAGIIDSDISAHIQEHSLEVQIPFLQYFSEDFKIVPISMWMQDIETSYDVGKSIKNVAETLQKDIVVIASSDMTHYQPQNIANQNDSYVLDAIKAMDEKLMIKRIMERNITMCGYGPVASTIIASKELGARESQILKYATSGDITGDLSAVVGYASAMFW